MSEDPDTGGGTAGTGDRRLPPAELDRVFDVLEAAAEESAVTEREFGRLLSVLERAVGGTADTDPEALAELLSVLGAFVADAGEDARADIDGVLSVFEEGLAAAADADDEVADVSDVIAEALYEPGALEPADVERLRAGLEGLFRGLADRPGESGRPPSMPAVPGETEPGSPAYAFRVARLAAVLTRRATGYSVESGLRVGTRLAYTAANAESLAKLLTASRAIALDELRRAGVDIGDERRTWLETQEAGAEPRPLSRERLRERGERLISQSTEVGRDESVHPAFASILDQLSTDEARILRLLATEGPQGVVDIYDRQYLPPKSWRVARNLTMLGRDAGCRSKRRTPVYVRNLRRLGLAEISEDPVDELKRYEVIEAQSHVDRAFDRARRPRTEYKRIQLTDLGVAFCELCFPFEVRVEGEGLAVRDAGE